MNHEEFVNKVSVGMQSMSIVDDPVLVALSGGADSVALLRVLLELRCDCMAAHCNFHLRGNESIRDEQFVRDLCRRLDVPLTVKDFDVAAWQSQHGGSVEMACRELRYHWFEQVRRQQACSLIAVAHHADDQVETFFLNLLRGTGLRGLTGMERLNHKIWRPLLTVSRADILDYLDSIGQDYVTDSTNAQNDYRRNRLRNIVLPSIEQQFPQSRERVLGTMENLGRDYHLLVRLASSILPDERRMPIDTLVHAPEASTLLYHRVRHMGFNRDQCVQAIESALHKHTGRQFIGKGHIMAINRDEICIQAIHESNDIEIPLDLNANGLQHPISLSIHHDNPPFSPLMCNGRSTVAFSTQILDCKHVILRHWRRGDRIKPYGLKGSKLVSDVFADMKLSNLQKGSIWIMEADGEIMWILGLRASSHYSVPQQSQDYLLLTLE